MVINKRWLMLVWLTQLDGWSLRHSSKPEDKKKLQVFGGIKALDEAVTFFYYWSLHVSQRKEI
jgi:hypothetical protein